MIFRQEDDRGTTRLKPTPPKETLLKNIESFSRKWKHISETSTDSHGLLLRESFDKQVENLKKHIQQGCLSGIPPGYSTSINESLHNKINNLFAGAKMGPELALALLTVFFYSWNSRRKNKINGLPVVEPLSSAATKDSKGQCDYPPKEQFGLGSSVKDFSAPVVVDDVQNEVSENNDTVSKRAMAMLRLHNFLNGAAKNESGLNWYDLFFHNDILRYVCKNHVSSHDKNYEQNQTSSIFGIAARYGMEIVLMPKDGNCLLRAVAFTISQRFSTYAPTLSTCQHYVDLGINQDSTIDDITKILRSLMTNELRRNKNAYLPFLQNITNEQYDKFVVMFEQPGVFAGDFGDLMVRALSNVLKIPLILLTDIENYSVIAVTPEEFDETNDNIFIAYTTNGPGHYDAVIESLQTSKIAGADVAEIHWARNPKDSIRQHQTEDEKENSTW